MTKKLYLLAFAILAATGLSAQDKALCQEIDNKDAVKYYEKGLDRKKNPNFDDRVAFMQQALQAEPDFAEANLEMGKMMMTIAKAKGDENNYGPALKYLKKAVEVCPKISAEPYYWVAKRYYIDEKYEECIPYLEKYIKFDADDAKQLGKDYEFNVEQCHEMLRWAKFYRDIYKNPKPFVPTPVTNICTENDEYLAIITPDNTQCWYIRTQPYNKRDAVFNSDKMIEVFTMSERQANGTFSKGNMLSPPFNRNANEGGPTLTIDNKHLVYTITKPGKEGDNTDLYTTDFVNGEWTEIRPLGEKVNDPKYWDSQPSMSSDGKTLYFASDRPGGLGGTDIYITRKGANGEWGAPENVGAPINTPGQERSPFIHSDSETLYFSSDGLPGVGGLDIFYVRKETTGKWKEPVNIGIPINTESDDLSFFVSTDGHSGYFSSRNANVAGTKGGIDLFSFPLYKEARPEEGIIIAKGEVRTPEGEKYSGNIDVEIKSAKTGEKIDVVIDTTSGDFAAAIKTGKKEDLVVTLKKEGVAFSSQLLEIEKNPPPTDVPLKIPALEIKEIKIGETYTLNNIYFGSNSASLEQRSKAVLKEFAEYLKNNKNLKIEIYGHTDNVGDRNSNLGLSKERALVVLEALTEEFGVPKSQVRGFSGFGPDKPVADNGTESGRAKNRRTEFAVVEK